MFAVFAVLLLAQQLLATTKRCRDVLKHTYEQVRAAATGCPFRLRRPTKKPQAGDRLVVTAELISDSSRGGQSRIPSGVKGTITKVEADGEMYIYFDEITGCRAHYKWISDRDIRKVRISDGRLRCKAENNRFHNEHGYTGILTGVIYSSGEYEFVSDKSGVKCHSPLRLLSFEQEKDERCIRESALRKTTQKIWARLPTECCRRAAARGVSSGGAAITGMSSTLKHRASQLAGLIRIRHHQANTGEQEPLTKYQQRVDAGLVDIAEKAHHIEMLRELAVSQKAPLPVVTQLIHMTGDLGRTARSIAYRGRRGAMAKQQREAVMSARIKGLEDMEREALLNIEDAHQELQNAYTELNHARDDLASRSRQ